MRLFVVARKIMQNNMSGCSAKIMMFSIRKKVFSKKHLSIITEANVKYSLFGLNDTKHQLFAKSLIIFAFEKITSENGKYDFTLNNRENIYLILVLYCVN